MANHPRLPLEVVEQIIDLAAPEYWNEDFRSLKACALVCHSFLPLCRKHIFASVTLNERHPPSPTSDDLNHLLSNSPHLAVYIRDLDYNFNEKEFVAKRLPWLSSMFKKLVKLKVLRISCLPHVQGIKFDWMSSSNRKVLLPLLHLPTLTSIRLSTIRNFSLADLAGCVNLKKLEIWCLECSTGVGKFLEALPATPVMLEGLVIEEGNVKPVEQLCHARRPDGKPIIDFSSLKKLEATVGRLDSLTEFFGMCRNLHKIKLTIERDVSPDAWESTLSLKGLFTMLKPSLPTLVDIRLEYYINNDDEETSDGPLAGLLFELEKMAGQNVIKTIEFLVWVHSGWYDCTRWGELDNILMGSPEDWPALREVSLSFDIETREDDDTDMAARKLPAMTKLVESERVEFDLDIAMSVVTASDTIRNSV